MADPERFRRHLKFDDELSWVCFLLLPPSQPPFFSCSTPVPLAPPRRPRSPESPFRPPGNKLTHAPSQRLEPIGRDAKKNEYYHTLDNRLWIKRAPPPGPRVALKIRISFPFTSKPSASRAKPTPKSRSAPKSAPAASTSRAPPKERATKRVAEEVDESPRKRGRRERDEVWEAIPVELLQEWDEPAGKGKGKAREGSVASSGLTSLSEEEDEMELDEPEPDVVQDEEAAEEKGVDEEEESVEVEEAQDEYDGRMQWEKDYWTERARCDKDGFVEWEAVSRSALLWSNAQLMEDCRSVSRSRSGRRSRQSSPRRRIATSAL